MTYEELLKVVDKEKIELFENNHIGKMDGLYLDNTITINTTNLTTDAEKRSVLAEELGHHYKTYGDIIDQTKIENRKQERLARAWAYDNLIGIIGIVNAYNYGCRNRYEMAEFLHVSEQFLEEAVNYYYEKYGLFYEIDNYIVYFNPLGIMEKF